MASKRRRLAGRRIIAAAAAIVAVAAVFAPGAIAQEGAQGQGGAGPAPTATMVLPEPPMVSLQAMPAYGPAPLMVGFLLKAVDPAQRGIISYKWNFGDGHYSTAPPLSAYNTYTRPGTYVATCTVTTADGRSATGFAGVVVKQSSTSGRRAPQAH
jgi:PKD repeat protein